MSPTETATLTTKIEHTQTPWHVGPHYKSDVESAFGRICECTPLQTERGAANAEFIVRACNAHNDMYAVLRAISEDASAYPWHHAVRAALAKAEGK